MVHRPQRHPGADLGDPLPGRGRRPGARVRFQLRGSWTRWGYTFEPVDGGTRLTESWHFPPDAVASFRERYGEEADARLEIHKQQMREGIPATLAAAEDIAATR